MAAVLMISYSGSLGGAERALIDFAPALEGDQYLACPEGPLAERARAGGIRVLPVRERPLDLRSEPVLATLRLLAFRREARALVRDLDPGLVVACGMRSALAVLLPRPSQAVVFTHHNLLPGPLLGRLVRAAAARATLVVVPSRTVAQDLGPSVPAIVVHPGVEIERFAAAGRPAQPPTVLMLGAVAPVKRPELALSVLALARAQRHDLRLRIVGAPLGAAGDALRERLRERAARPDLEGAVDLVGAVDDPFAELERATCLLHCASREAFGLAVVEALATGRPVIAPAATGPMEIIDDTCGVLYPPDDAPAAASALLELIGDPGRATALGRAGQARVRERFGVADARDRFAAAVAPLQRADRKRPDGGSLALVTVTHNSAPELAALLESVRQHMPRARVVVVDCASTEPLSVPRGVELIALDDNVGFGRACNIGIGTVAEPVTALINPDVTLVDSSLLELADEARRGPARLLAPLVLSPDGSRQDTVHPVPASPRDLAATVIPGGLLAPWRSGRPRRVGWAVGCALVARTEILRSLGPFDERIFLYGEDLDLGLRATAAGVETWFWPAARVMHARAHSTSRAFGGEPFEQLARARHDAVARCLGPGRARLDDAGQALTFASRIAVKRALGRDTTRERAQLRAVRRAP